MTGKRDGDQPPRPASRIRGTTRASRKPDKKSSPGVGRARVEQLQAMEKNGTLSKYLANLRVNSD